MHLYNEQEYEVRKEIKTLLVEEKGRIKTIQTYLNEIDIKNINELKAYDFVINNYYEIAIRVNEIIAKQFSILDKKQIAKFKKSIKKENKKIELRNKERTPKNMFKRYSYFFGDLTDDQKKMVTDNMDLFLELSNERMKKRIGTQKSLLSVYLSIVNQIKKCSSKLYLMRTLTEEK